MRHSRPEQAIDDQEHDLAVLRRLLDEPDRTAVKGHAHYLLKLNELPSGNEPLPADSVAMKKIRIEVGKRDP